MGRVVVELRHESTNRLVCMNRIAHHCCLAVLCWLVVPLGIECGESTLVRGDQLAEPQIELAGNDVLAGLEHTGEFIKDGQWSDAVATLIRIMENHGQALIQAPVTAPAKELGFAKFITVSEHCQRELASWHVQAPRRWPPIARGSMNWLGNGMTKRSRHAVSRSCNGLSMSCC